MLQVQLATYHCTKSDTQFGKHCSSRSQKDGSQRCPPDRGHICVSRSSAYMTQTTEHVVMQPSCRESHNLPDRSKQSCCPLCQRLFQLYKKGARGWNTKPYNLCIERYRTQKHRKRHLTPKLDSSPPEPGLQTLEFTSPTDPQLSSVRTNHRPVSRHKPNKCNMLLSAVHRNTTMQNPHYIFKDGQWATAHMREHPKVQLTISVERAQTHGESTPVRATNVTAIADTGAQVNVWSLDEFVKYGFPHDILTPASNLVPANHSSISIVGAFFAIIEGLSCDGYVVQCRAMVYISADIQTFLLHGTLSTLGVLSSSFPSLGEHANANMQKCAGEPAAITNAHLMSTAAPHLAIKIILALALNVLPCHHPHVRYHFAVFPKIMIE